MNLRYLYTITGLIFLLLIYSVYVHIISFICLIFRIKTKKYVLILQKWSGKNITFLANSKIDVSGQEHVKKNKGYIIVANHISSFDIYMTSGYLPNWNFFYMPKNTLFNYPVLGSTMRALGHIPIYRNNPEKGQKAVKQAVKQINEYKDSLLIFAEGTRSIDGNMIPFKSGLARILSAFEEANVLPVVICGTDKIMPRKQLKIYPGKGYMKILPPIKVNKSMFKTSKMRRDFLNQLQQDMKKEHEDFRMEKLGY